MLQTNSVFLITFGIIAMGFIVKKYNFITEAEGKVISRFLMHTTFPALMIISTAKVKLTPNLFLIPFLCIGISSFMIFISSRIFKNISNYKTKAILLMGSGGMNVGLFGFPLIEGIWGTEALVYAVMYDIGNMVVTFGIIYSIGVYFSQKDKVKVNVKALLKRVFSLPPVTGMFIGLTINIFKIPVPEIAFDFLTTLASANKALVLLLMGIYLSFELEKSLLKSMSKVIALRFITGLCFSFGIYCIFPEPSMMRSVLMILVILPLGMTILPFSDELGFDSRIAGTLLNISLVFSFCIIWLLVLGLGL